MNIGNASRRLALASSLALMLGAAPAGAGDKPLDIGKGEYEAACAVCHGYQGKGDGPLAAQLKTATPDLTSLARNNGGVFPFDRVYKIIDGRQEVKAHGTLEMPVWGRAFSRQSSVYFENYPPHDPESAVRSRILALTEYLYRLQGK